MTQDTYDNYSQTIVTYTWVLTVLVVLLTLSSLSLYFWIRADRRRSIIKSKSRPSPRVLESKLPEYNDNSILLPPPVYSNEYKVCILSNQFLDTTDNIT
ncbi:hypothetical protein CONCODRAFT_13175 [Conidiobolus coronatus NRRL 28638]|uniref:Uncharacterized protein n=1 Tax=Conidiobolus coronatus (strain ATCC 28846 / CBS 209.66 / NRRL 28638) TaxID=796925 RepID=A0A137NRC6_CONC2|nr:hypothetical protein CONCODRAFT_13175 [Conidiobolus coronatus NRRL 28638]|eukprot:KXN65287.1 hypothetical protein CONCODRAFT_13175 [Conidiobolus coronatus NRRL 28638]